MTVMVWYSQGVGGGGGGGYMLCDSDGMVQSRWGGGVHVV